MKPRIAIYGTLSFCLILGLGNAVVLGDDNPPTFSAQIASIVLKKCSSCHRPNSSAPFSLLSYEGIKRHSETIVAVIDEGYMPPWKPVDHGIAFANDRSLSPAEKKLFREWVDNGCQEGDPARTPPTPEFPDGWSLGTPDLILEMQGSFNVPAEGPDVYRSFVFPHDATSDRWVKAVELRPQAKTAVHHAIFFLDTQKSARKLDSKDGQAGVAGMSFLSGFAQSDNAQPLNRGLGGYVPGSTPNRLPGDYAMSLPRGADILMQTHFHPSGKPETEHAKLGLYFADGPPRQQLVPIQLPAMFGFAAKIRIPAGEANFKVTDRFTLSVDTKAIGVSGHAHYICRDMKLTATLPDGSGTKTLLHIDDWDLDWQDQYYFAEPVELPAKTELVVELTYDNSEENPENPNYPPQEIRWGRGSTDEMGSVTLMTVASQPMQQAKLQRSLRTYTAKTLMGEDGKHLAQMLMQLDNNRDGMLEASEAPPRLAKRAFGFADTDKNGALDEQELVRMLRFRNLLGR